MTESNNWDDYIRGLIKIYKNGDDDEPLDGDEIDKLIKIISAKINLIEGNVTSDEYEELLNA